METLLSSMTCSSVLTSIRSQTFQWSTTTYNKKRKHFFFVELLLILCASKYSGPCFTIFQQLKLHFYCLSNTFFKKHQRSTFVFRLEMEQWQFILSFKIHTKRSRLMMIEWKIIYEIWILWTSFCWFIIKETLS